MKHTSGKLIMGATLSLVAIAAAIDHTQHALPEVEVITTDQATPTSEPENPCGLGANPCGLGANPCGLGANPCSLGGAGANIED